MHIDLETDIGTDPVEFVPDFSKDGLDTHAAGCSQGVGNAKPNNVLYLLLKSDRCCAFLYPGFWKNALRTQSGGETGFLIVRISPLEVADGSTF
jgi:hypothetical protein